MSDLTIDYDKLRGYDPKALHEFEAHIWSALDREAAARREAKHGGDKKKRVRRRPGTGTGR